MFKRILAVALVVALTVTLLAGCTGKKAEEPKPAEPKKEPVTITYMTFTAAPDHIKDLDAIVKAFEAKNSDIKVQVQPVAWNDYWTKLQTAVAGGTAPDAFELNYENFVSYAKKGALLDMTTLIANDKSFDPKVYYPKAYQVFQYSGKQYGLVETFSNVLLFYNKDLFDKAKVDYPKADWKWDDEIKAAQKLTDAKAGVWGTFAPIQFWEFYKVIAQNGGKILDGDKVVIDSKENVEALKYMVDKIRTYKVTPTDAQMGGQKEEDLFKAGKLAMLHTGIWMFGAFKDVPFKWDIALEPGNTQKAHHFFSNAVAISKDTKKAEAAWKWAKFLTSSPEASKIRVEASWELPALSDPKLVEGYLKQTPPPSRQVVFDALNSPVVPPVIDKWNEMTDQIGKELDQAKLGKITPAEALANAKKKLEALVK